MSVIQTQIGLIQENGFDFEACRVGGNIIITLRNSHGEEINATFSVPQAGKCADEIATAILGR